MPLIKKALAACASASSSAPSQAAASKLLPKSAIQKKLLRVLQKPEQPCIVVATGPAGCGKTMLATAVGMQKLAAGEVSKLVITRPTVSVDEQHGYLPGSLDEKMKPWARPVLDAMETVFKPSQIDAMIKSRVVELAPLGFMRGRTFKHAWIVLDEAQNTTSNQMLMMLTRIGEKSKIVVTGDLDQHDRGFDCNGLSDLIQRMQRMPEEHAEWMAHIEFGAADVVRHPVIPVLLDLYQAKK